MAVQDFDESPTREHDGTSQREAMDKPQNIEQTNEDFCDVDVPFGKDSSGQ
jgi:hypothetical protein